MNAVAFPHRRDDVIVVHVGTDAALYDPEAPAVHRVNASALLVWKCCDGSADVGSISDDLAETFSEPLASTRSLVEELIDEFRVHGLLRASVLSTTSPSESAVRSVPHKRPASWSTVRRLGPYGAIDARFTIECLDTDPIADELERVLDSLRVDTADRDGGSSTSITAWTDGDGCHFDADGFQLTAPDESMLVDFAVQQITYLAIEGSPRYLVLHASTLARDGRAVLLPARANSGKSTLAAIMVEAGFHYLTDEASFLDLETGDVVAFPKPITLDPGSQRLLPHLEPFGIAGQSPKWQIAPNSIRPEVVVERAKLAHIVLPTHDVDADNAMTAVDTIDGVVALLAAAVNVAGHATRLDALVALVASCTVHSLRHDGIDGPRAAIESLFSVVR